MDNTSELDARLNELEAEFEHFAVGSRDAPQGGARGGGFSAGACTQNCTNNCSDLCVVFTGGCTLSCPEGVYRTGEPAPP